MISYDRYSELGAGEENRYYEFRGSNWYNLARKSSGESQFTDTYWDGYGRGLTVTCVAPFTVLTEYMPAVSAWIS